MHAARIKVVVVTVSLMASFLVEAGTVVDVRRHNPVEGGMMLQKVQISDNWARVDFIAHPGGDYVLEEFEKGVYHRVTEQGKTVITDQRSARKSKGQAILEKVGLGPTWLGHPTVHYRYMAGDVVCNNLYLADLDSPDLKRYFSSMTSLPIKLQGMTVSKNERACQQAAVDGANKMRELGVPLKITNQAGQKLFVIIRIQENISIPKEVFRLPEQGKQMSEEQMLKSAMEQAVLETVLAKIDQKPSASKEEKEQLKQEVQQAYEGGRLMEFLKQKAEEEKSK